MKHIKGTFDELLNRKVWIYGAGSIGKDAYEAIKTYAPSVDLLGFIDKASDLRRIRPSIKTIAPRDIQIYVEPDHLIVIATTMQYVNEIFFMLEKSLIKSQNILLFRFHDFDLYGNKSHERMSAEKIKLKKLIERNPFLNYDHAKKILEAIISSNLDALPEPEEHRKIFRNLIHQCLGTRNSSVFLNAGCVSGTDFEDMKASIGIENMTEGPTILVGCDVRLNREIQRNFFKRENLTVINAGFGLSSEDSEGVYFSIEGTRSRFKSNRSRSISSEIDGSYVRTKTMGSLLELAGVKKIDFIKMDIEGLEFDVLMNAKKIIERDRPFLFVSAYHLIDDITEMLGLIEGFDCYKIYLYSFDSDGRDIVIVGIPALE